MASPQPADNSDETEELLNLARDGNQEAWARLLKRYERRLHVMLKLRLNPRIERREDVSDVMQKVRLEAFLHLTDFMRERRMPFYCWLRGIAKNKLMLLYRHHGRKARDLAVEVPIDPFLPHASSVALAEMLSAHEPRPSEAVRKQEEREQLYQALERMDPVDREVLALRHFEKLTNDETAAELEMTPAAASKRYTRALLKLRDILTSSRGCKDLGQ
jgi:RNA polymerase sigma-70 factor (ECF subfamily)